MEVYLKDIDSLCWLYVSYFGSKMESPSQIKQLDTAHIFANANVMRDFRFPQAPSGFDMPLICRGLDDLLRKLHESNLVIFPELRKHFESISVFSDYSGEDSASRFLTYSFMICAYRPLEFAALMRKIRRQYGLIDEPITIEFKKLRHGKVSNVLPHYFRLLDNLVPGLLVTIAVAKDIPDLIVTDTVEGRNIVLEELSSHDLGGWKPAVAIKMLRIVHIVAYLCALLVDKKQNIFWMMDADAIVANDKLSAKTMSIFSSLLSAYGLQEPGNVGWAVPFEDRSDMTFRDLLSAADLAAGGIAHVIERTNAKPPRKTAPRVWPVLEWLSSQGIGLRKVSIGVYRHSKTKLHYSLLAPLGPNHTPTDSTQVLVQI